MKLQHHDWLAPPTEEPEPWPGGYDHPVPHCYAGVKRCALSHELMQLTDIDALRRCYWKKSSDLDELIALYA